MSNLKGRPIRMCAGVLALLAAGAVGAGAREPAIRVTQLLATGKTVMDEPIVYPTSGPAKLTTMIVEMAPGSETGWHTHGIPITGLILKGELTVDYGARGTRTYREGDSIAEAIDIPHNGKNTGPGIMRLFVVYIGADGLKTTIPIKR